MNNTLYEKFIREIQEIRMTRDEKDRVLKAILSPETHAKTMRIQSPWNIYTVRSWIHMHKTVSFALSLIVIVSLGGGGIVSAAEGALPGDTLYPVKVSVVEPVQVALKTSPETRAVAQSELVNRRLEEAEILAVKDLLDDEKTATVEALVDEHTRDFAVEIEKVKAKGSIDTADDISGTLQSQMNAHVAVLSNIEAEKHEVPEASMALMAVPASSRADAPTMAMKAMLEKRTITSIIAEKAASIQTEDEHGTSTQSIDEDNYEYKKNVVKKYIKETQTKLKDEYVPSEDDRLKVRIIEDSNDSLKEAVDSFKSAEEHEKSGEKSKAYAELRKSERATGRANTLITSGIKIDKEIGKEKKGSAKDNR